jgi:hypothetical protein
MVQAPTSVPAGVDHRNITAAAADILALINSRPTSPRLEEIEQIIARIPNVLTPMGAEYAGGDEIEGEPATFEALSVTFDWANLEFGERFLPWVRLACEWLQRDYIGTQALVRDMLRKGGEVSLDEADRAWKGCAEIFGTIGEFVEAARVRLGIARAQIKDPSADAVSTRQIIP